MVPLNLYFSCFICSLQLTLIDGVNEIYDNKFIVSNNEDNITMLTELIVKHCFEHNIIFLTSRKDHFISKEAYSKSLKIFDVNRERFIDYKRFRKNLMIEEEHVSNKNYPSLGVIINILPDMNIEQILENLRNSFWWNSRSLFLLINREVCTALENLKVLWDFKITSVIYICKEAASEVSLYTFNPYSSLAPSEWRKVESINESWTLFKLRYQQDLTRSELCSTFFFEKEKDLHGYRLKVLLDFETQMFYTLVNNNLTFFFQNRSFMEFGLYIALCETMNATLDTKLSDGSVVYNHDNLSGMWLDLLYDKVDIWIADNMQYNWKFMTDPVYFESFFVWVNETPINFATQFSFFFEWNFWFVFILTCVTSILILKFALQKATSLAIIQFVQIALSSSSVKEPRRFYGRILLFVLVIACSTINLMMQLLLNFWSALPKYERKVQFIEDAVNLNLTFYGRDDHEDIILLRSEIKKFRIAINLTDECIEMLSNGEQMACIVNKHTFDTTVWWQSPLIYTLKNSAFDCPGAFFHAEDFPLIDRLNQILAIFRDAGIFNWNYYIKGILEYNIENEIEFGSPKEKAQVEYKALKLEEIIFCAYVFLGGWALAVVAFIAESLINKIKMKRRKKNSLWGKN